MFTGVGLPVKPEECVLDVSSGSFWNTKYVMLIKSILALLESDSWQFSIVIQRFNQRPLSLSMACFMMTPVLKGPPFTKRLKKKKMPSRSWFSGPLQSHWQNFLAHGYMFCYHWGISSAAPSKSFGCFPQCLFPVTKKRLQMSETVFLRFIQNFQSHVVISLPAPPNIFLYYSIFLIFLATSLSYN